jgi:hypothetical protein
MKIKSDAPKAERIRHEKPATPKSAKIPAALRQYRADGYAATPACTGPGTTQPLGDELFWETMEHTLIATLGKEKGELAYKALRAAAAVASGADNGSTPSRGLTDAEKTAMQAIFGDKVNYGDVRVVQMTPELEEMLSKMSGGSARPFCLGNTIFLPKDTYQKLLNPPAPGSADWEAFRTGPLETLSHEMTHVWQYQHSPKGSGLLIPIKSLVGQFFQGATREGTYNYSRALFANLPFDKWNPEQQALFTEDLFRGGFFDQPGCKLYLRDLGNGKWDYRVVKPGEDPPQGDGWVDYTKQANDWTKKLGTPPPQILGDPLPVA